MVRQPADLQVSPLVSDDSDGDLLARHPLEMAVVAPLIGAVSGLVCLTGVALLSVVWLAILPSLLARPSWRDYFSDTLWHFSAHGTIMQFLTRDPHCHSTEEIIECTMSTRATSTCVRWASRRPRPPR